jgi:hypothetical protein
MKNFIKLTSYTKKTSYIDANNIIFVGHAEDYNENANYTVIMTQNSGTHFVTESPEEVISKIQRAEIDINIFLTSLKDIVEYLKEEEKDYNESDEETKVIHIWNDVLRLKEFINQYE